MSEAPEPALSGTLVRVYASREDSGEPPGEPQRRDSPAPKLHAAANRSRGESSCPTRSTPGQHRPSALAGRNWPRRSMEAIWVAAEMRAGGAYAHSTLALDVLGGGTDDSGHTHEHHRE